MGELALRYPPGSLVVSTGREAGSETSGARFPHAIDRVGIRAKRLRTINGLVLWGARAGALARGVRPGFVWCGELKPAGYPASWLQRRYGLPYGLVTYGTELLLLDAKIRRSAFKRWTARELVRGCAVVVATPPFAWADPEPRARAIARSTTPVTESTRAVAETTSNTQILGGRAWRGPWAAASASAESPRSFCRRSS